MDCSNFLFKYYIGILQGIIITVDIIRYPQKMMPIMNIVWPLTGLYFPIVGFCAYYQLGRNKDPMQMDMGDMNMEASMEMDMNMDHGSHHMEHHHEHMQHDHSHMHHHHENKPFW